MPACRNCGHENPEGAKFCLECGTPFAAAAAAPAAPTEERKTITAVFTDIVDSTAAASRLDPEDVRARLSPYYARVRTELERFGGTVEKFIGDAVVAVFGAPVSHEDDPERAVRAALAVRDAVAALNADDEWLDLHIRTAVHTGEALVILDAPEGEGIAAGDVMNVAARIQSSAPRDGIVVGEATYRATEDAFEYHSAEPVIAKGKTEPVPIWEVVGEKRTSLRPTARSPLVGRSAELERLRSLWDRVRTDRRPQIVTLVGAPGIGKTRLLQALCHHAEQDGAVHWGRCLSYGEGITYWPASEIVKDAAGIRYDDDAEAVSDKLGALLDALPCEDEDELRTMAAAIANVTGAATTPRGTYAAAEIGQAELHWGIRRVLQLRAVEKPVLLVFEDLHWAEPTLLELIAQLGSAGQDAGLLIVGTARPELAESRPALLARADNRDVVELAPLDDSESADLLAGLLEADLDRARLEVLLEKAGGNPLFLEEIVRMVADTTDGGGDLGSLPVPDSLQALIGSRLDALPLRDKRVAQHASVVGGVFWAGAVRHLEGDGDVRPSLTVLERRDVVRARAESSVAGEREYAFKHMLIRDVAYERLPKGRRAALHSRFSEWLSRLLGGDDELIEILAYHLERACRLARSVARSPIEPPVAGAVDALMRSAAKAERREGIREADRFYERALELVGADDPETAAEVRLRRCGTLVALGTLTEARDQLLGVAEEALLYGRMDLRCEALLALANVDKKQGRAGDARARLDEGERLAGEIGDTGLHVRAMFEVADLQSWFEGEPEAAAAGLRAAIRLADVLGDRSLRIEGRMRLGGVLFNVGKLHDATEELEQAIALAGDEGSLRDEARATSMLAFVTYYLGRHDEAQRLALQALEWLERTCDTYLQLQSLRVVAKYALAHGQATVAEERLRDSLTLALELGGWLEIEVYRYLAEALVAQGRVREARELVAFAARSLPEEHVYARAMQRVGEAIVAEAEGDLDAAAAALEEAARLFEEQQFVTDGEEARSLLRRVVEQRDGGTAGREPDRAPSRLGG